MNKRKIILTALCTILIFILVRACTNGLTNKIRDDIEKETVETISNELKQKYAENWIYSICDFLQGEIDYDEFPLSTNFKKKYKDIDSIVKGEVMGTLDVIGAKDVFDVIEDFEKQIMCITVKTGKGFEEIDYQLHYVINDKNELDDIEILDSRLYRYDTDGYPKYTFYKTHFQSPGLELYCLTNPKRYMNDGDVPYLTENYIKNHKDYKTESIIPWKDWLYIDERTIKQDENNDRIWYVEAVNTEEIRKYKIEFIIDERGYVDDYILEEIERREVVDKEEVLDIFNELYG